MRARPLARLAAAGVAATAVVGFAVPAAASSAPPVRSTVIVLLRAYGSPRASTSRALALADQATVATTAADLGATVLARTTVPAALTLRVTPAQADALARDPLVARVLPNTLIPGPAAPGLAVPLGASRTPARPPTAPPGACGTARHPQLDPEALTAIHDAPGTTLGFTGKGVTVAFLADGLQIASSDFKRNAQFASPGSPRGSAVISQYRDFSGDGTAARTGGGEAFLDASSIAAQGNVVYDLSRFVDPSHPLPRGCDARIVGAAPGASVEALKIFSSRDTTTSSGFIQAIDYAVAHRVSVINESFGGNGFPDTSADVVRAADEAAVAAGVTVVVSSGDAGISSTIGSPSTDPEVLSVGASTTFRAYQQDSFGGINLPGERDRFIDDNISSLSSGGFAQDGKTVDLVAPGDLNWTLCSAARAYTDCAGQQLQLSGGTSESSPLTAGAAADVIEAYRASHRGTSPAPALVSEILTSTATDLAAPATQQGAGLLDVAAAVRLALSLPGTTRAARPGGVLAGATEVNLAGAPSSSVSKSITLTNTSMHAVRVDASTRALVPVHVTSGAILLDPRASSHQRRFRVWTGAEEVYRVVRLHVGAHVGRIQLQAAYRDNDATSLLHVALFSPVGALAGYSNPQGRGDYADVEESRPAQGTWTAAFFTLWDGYQPGMTGTSGRIPYALTELRFAPAGTIAPPSVTLAAGASRTVTFHDTLPAAPGDTDASIVLREGTGASAAVTSIPTTLRTFVPTGAGGGHFAGTLSGGNGRGGAPGQTNTYVFTVPSGKRDLDVGVSMSSNPAAAPLPADQLIGMLVDPWGNVVAYDTNFTVATSGEVETRFVDLYAADPAAGTWELVLEWVQPGTGVRTAIPFTGSVEFDQVSVSSALPDAASAHVPTAGDSYTVTVHNTGVAPMIVSPDARLTTSVALPLPDLQGVSATQPLGGSGNEYYVPTETSSVSFDEVSTVPATFDASFAPGDPDLAPTVAAPGVTESWTPTASTLHYAPPGGVSAGLWNVVQAEVGPYPSRGEPSGSETTTATATTLAFDPAVTSSVPDTVRAIASGTEFNPDYVPAGATTSMTITITPTASVGTTVTGTLFIDGLTEGSQLTGTIGLTSLFTSDLAAIPYQYTVGP